MGRRKTILVADDSPTIVEIMSFMLTGMGYEVETASDGVEAIERIHHVRPDLILLDIEMPRMNGYQVCRLIKADRLTRGIPVLILTSRDLASDRFWGMATGADAYVVKDLEDETLFAQIERLLDESEGKADAGAQFDRDIGEGVTLSEVGVLEQVNALLDSRLFQSTIVNELGSLAVKMYDFGETAAAVLDLLAKVVDFAVAVLVVRDQAASFVQVRHQNPLSAQALETMHARLQTECEAHGLTASLDELREGSPEHGAPIPALVSFVALPLKSRNRVSAVLALGSGRENAFSDDLMETLDIFAHESAIVLDNSLLYRQLGRANRELQRTIDELRASKARERALRQEVRALKVEIDEAKRERQVAEITETDYFQQLRERAREIRAARD